MKKTLGLVALLAMGALTLAGCNKNAPVENPDENAEIPNPAAVYCEENGGTLNLEEWLCMFEDGSYCEEWSFKNWECQPGEIMYNTVEDFVGMPNPAAVYCVEQGGELVPMEDEEWNQYSMCRLADGTEVEEWEYYRANHPVTELSAEDLAAAEAVIRNEVENRWDVKIESLEVAYAGDEISSANLEYCQSFNAEATECAVFTSSFHIPEQDTVMAGAFEPNTDITGWSWYLGKNAAGEWEILSNGFG